MSNVPLYHSRSSATNDTSIILNYTAQHSFTLQSSNSEGSSLNHSVLRIYSPSETRHLRANSVNARYQNKTYTLFWRPASDYDSLENYTIFWCLARTNSRTQCKNSIEFEYLDKHTTNYTTKRQDESLNLAIAANYKDYSTGMYWAQCSEHIHSEINSIIPDIFVMNATSIRLSWIPTVCPSILKGYRLSYCRVDNNASGYCLENDTIIDLNLPDLRNYTLHDLKPFSSYSIGFAMFSSSMMGPQTYTNINTTQASE